MRACGAHVAGGMTLTDSTKGEGNISVEWPEIEANNADLEGVTAASELGERKVPRWLHKP